MPNWLAINTTVPQNLNPAAVAQPNIASPGLDSDFSLVDYLVKSKCSSTQLLDRPDFVSFN